MSSRRPWHPAVAGVALILALAVVVAGAGSAAGTAGSSGSAVRSAAGSLAGSLAGGLSPATPRERIETESAASRGQEVLAAPGGSPRAVPAQEQGDELPRVDDPESTRRAYLVMISLLVLGALLAAFTVWYWRSTRPEPHALGRLEAMGLRRWSRSDWTGRRDLLDRVGPYEGGEGPVTEREGELVAEAERVEAERVEAESIEEAQPRDDTPPADDTGEVDEPVLVPAGALTLAALVEATPAAPVAPYGGSIGDPEVLKALGLDDESLGITVPPVRRPWSTEDRVPVPFTDEDLLDADEDDDAEDDGFVDLPAAEAPTMEPMFEGLGAPAVWSGEDEVTEDEIHEREATGEFVRLVERGDHHDDPRPEQQRFSLPGEPLL